MGKDKLKRFNEIGTFPNVFEMNSIHKGNWNKNYFKNENPIVLELGCGRGEYTNNLAAFFPEKNFIGIDIKGARIWRGAKTALESGQKNVAFLRIEIEQLLEYFGPKEISEIWITFPDPQPQISRIRKRLTSDRFLEYYKLILLDDGFIHLKTDNDELFQFTIETLEKNKMKASIQTSDLYNSNFLNEVLSIQTTYEKIYRSKGKNINYVQYQF